MEIECLPSDIPSHIDVDVTELKFGQVLRVKGDDLRPGRQVGQAGAELIGNNVEITIGIEAVRVN